MMTTLPTDPMVLFSYINMKLRDDYETLDDLCEDMNLEKKILTDRLAEAGFEYNEKANKFW